MLSPDVPLRLLNVPLFTPQGTSNAVGKLHTKLENRVLSCVAPILPTAVRATCGFAWFVFNSYAVAQVVDCPLAFATTEGASMVVAFSCTHVDEPQVVVTQAPSLKLPPAVKRLPEGVMVILALPLASVVV